MGDNDQKITYTQFLNDKNKQLRQFSSKKIKQLLNNFLGQFEMENKKILVKLHKIWNIITKHLNCMHTSCK